MSGERKFRVAVIGATGLVGSEVVSLLAERGFPVSELLLFASEGTRGESLEWDGDPVEIHELERPLPEVDVAFLCATAAVSAEIGGEIAAVGALVIDLAPAAANAGSLALTAADARVALQAHGSVLRVPDPLTRLLAVPLLALRAVGVPTRAVATLIVSASRFGKGAVVDLGRETIALLNLEVSEDESEPTVAFRCTPLGPEAAARRVEAEVRALVGETLPIAIHVVRAPIFHGHAASLAIQFESPVDLAAARARLRDAPSLLVAEEGAGPISTLDALAIDAMHVTELSSDAGDPTWLHFWVLGDNVRQGAALAAVALAEGILLRH